MKRIARMRPTTLTAIFKKHRLKAPERIAEKVQALARTATPPPVELSTIMSSSLAVFARLLREYENAIAKLEENCAKLLVQTPCFMLLTFPGISIVTAAEIASELGDPDSWKPAKHTASYGGIVRRTKTTGDPNKGQPQGGKLPWDCNHRLKNAILWAAMHIGEFRHPIHKISSEHDGEHPLRKFSNRKKVENGKHVLATAKKLVRTMTAVVKGQTPYMSKSIQPESMDHGYELTRLELASAVRTLSEKTKGIGFSEIPDERNLLKLWVDNNIREYELDKLEL